MAPFPSYKLEVAHGHVLFSEQRAETALWMRNLANPDPETFIDFVFAAAASPAYPQYPVFPII